MRAWCRAHKGDEAFPPELIEEILHVFRGEVRNLFLRDGWGDEADDQTQEVFIRVFQSLPRFRAESELRTWIYRIATNLLIDAGKKRKRIPRPLSSLDSGEGGSEPMDDDRRPQPEPVWGKGSVDPQEEVEREDNREAVRNAIEHLPEKYRVVVLLREYKQLSYGEIAEVLGIPLGTVKVQHSRALRMLAGRLRSLRGEEGPALQDEVEGP